MKKTVSLATRSSAGNVSEIFASTDEDSSPVKGEKRKRDPEDEDEDED